MSSDLSCRRLLLLFFFLSSISHFTAAHEACHHSVSSFNMGFFFILSNGCGLAVKRCLGVINIRSGKPILILYLWNPARVGHYESALGLEKSLNCAVLHFSRP